MRHHDRALPVVDADVGCGQVLDIGSGVILG
jgi:hypothetical protein